MRAAQLEHSAARIELFWPKKIEPVAGIGSAIPPFDFPQILNFRQSMVATSEFPPKEGDLMPAA